MTSEERKGGGNEDSGEGKTKNFRGGINLLQEKVGSIKKGGGAGTPGIELIGRWNHVGKGLGGGRGKKSGGG